MSIGAREFAWVADVVRSRSAIVLDAGKEYLVEGRLQALARTAGHPDVTSYVAALARRPDPRAVAAVVEALTTNETSWFRDHEPFTALRETVLPTLAATRPGRRLRVWCGASSSGQEPYTVAMTVLDTPVVAGWSVEIVATDLSSTMVERTRRGEYSQLEVNRGLPAPLLVRHFQRDGLSWRVSPQLRSMVSAREHNLLHPLTALGTFDVVFLRNVLIYFDVATRRDVLRRVRQSLAPDGYLFLGAAETTRGVDDGWEREPVGRSALYRLSGATAPTTRPPTPTPSREDPRLCTR